MLQVDGGRTQTTPNVVERSVSSARETAQAVTTGWRETGGLGRVGIVGVALSALVAVVLGFEISAAMRTHMLDVRVEALQQVAAEVTGGVVDDAGLAATAASMVDAVDRRLIGGDVVGAAVRAADGTVLARVGRAPTRTPRGGSSSSPLQPATVAPAHVEQHADGLLHFRLPVHDTAGEAVGTLEVFQASAAFDAVLDRVARDVWVAIALGLGLLGLAMGGMVVANARVIARGRDDAKRLLGALLRAEEVERRRVVGSLHDDVGQPLYRLLYGLQGCRAKVDGDSPLAGELDRMTGLVRQVDRTLRSELHRLHRGVLDDVDLRTALADLVAAVARDAGLEHRFAAHGEVGDLAVLPRSALLRAAQEALANVQRHAAATAVDVRLGRVGRKVVLAVGDDGIGWDGREGMGLASCRERLESLGGGLAVVRARSGGTQLQAWVPVLSSPEVGS